MNASHERAMHYHADASPFGGILIHPFERVVPSEASVSLSQSGGHAVARIDCFHFDELIHTGPAFSRVAGSTEKTNGNATTLVTSVVENLNVLQVVTADRIVSQIAVEHPIDGYYPKVSFAGSQFQGLRINGRPVDPHFDHHFLASPVHQDRPPRGIRPTRAPRDPVPASGQSPPASSSSPASPGRRWKLHHQGRPPEKKSNRHAWCSGLDQKALQTIRAWRPQGSRRLLTGPSVTGAAPCPTYGHVIHVHGFGNIFLGELQVYNHSFHLTMLRIEMGCAAGGNLSFVTCNTNGGHHP